MAAGEGTACFLQEYILWEASCDPADGPTVMYIQVKLSESSRYLYLYLSINLNKYNMSYIIYKHIIYIICVYAMYTNIICEYNIYRHIVWRERENDAEKKKW